MCNGSKQTISASCGLELLQMVSASCGLELLQMVSKLITGQCANKEVGPPKGMDCGISHQLGRRMKKVLLKSL